MKTFWLYYNGQPIHAVRLPAGSSEAAIKDKARRELDANPGIYCTAGYAPFEHRIQIKFSEVRQ